MILTFEILLLMAGAAQGQQWTYRLAWEHDGSSVSHYEVCSGNECRRLDASRQGGNVWTAPLPLLPQGFYTLVVYACNSMGCTPGSPNLSVNVLPGPTIGEPGTPPPGTPPPPTTGQPPPVQQPRPGPPTQRYPPRRPPGI